MTSTARRSFSSTTLPLVLLAGTFAACSERAVSSAPVDGPAIDWDAELTGLVDRAMVEEHVPGAAVVVVQAGETVYQRGFGVADVRSAAPVDPETTIFRIGSITKTMTCFALTHLADQGKLSLEDPVSRYVPEIDDIPNVSGSDEPLLLRHLVTHTSGLDQIGLDRHVWELELSIEERQALRPSLREFLFDGNLRRTSPPGKHFRYDTYGTTLAGLVVEVVTGKPYGEAMVEALFEPAGMTGAGVALSRRSTGNMAVGHGWVDGEYGVAPYEVYVTQPASSVDATAADMASLLRQMTTSGDSPLFSAVTKEAVLAPQFRPHPGFSGATHGLQEFQRAGGRDGGLVRGVGHGGTMLGFRSNLMFLPEFDAAIFVTVNRNREAGGDGVTVDRQVVVRVAELLSGGRETLYPAAQPPPADAEIPYDDYVGRFAYGIFCKTCTPEEFERGAWEPFSFLEVRRVEGGLTARDITYRPTAEEDVFQSEDHARRLFFHRDAAGVVQTVSFAGSPDTFERLAQG
ncbi:MAG: serine hydrolase domain-containing protein [Acidobacteriota bacterium]